MKEILKNRSCYKIFLHLVIFSAYWFLISKKIIVSLEWILQYFCLFQNHCTHNPTGTSGHSSCHHHSLPVALSHKTITCRPAFIILRTHLSGIFQRPSWSTAVDDFCLWTIAIFLLATSHIWKGSRSTVSQVLSFECRSQLYVTFHVC